MSNFEELTFQALEEMLFACGGDIKGTDTDDDEYDSIEVLFDKVTIVYFYL